MADAFSTSFDQLIDDVMGLAYKIVVSTSNAAATVTTTSEIVSSIGGQESSDMLNNRGIWIPSAVADADKFRVVAAGGWAFSAAGSVVTLTPTNTTNYSQTLEDVTGYLIASGLTPDDLFALANDALEEITHEAYEPVKTIGDGMQGANVDSDWVENAATDTVDDDAAKLGPYGQQVFDVVDSGAGGGYTQTALVGVPQSTRGRLHGIVQSITGTSRLSVLDGSDNEQGYVETAQTAAVYLGKQVDFDSTDETARVRLTQVTASGEGYWTAAWYTRQDQTQFRLPSYIDARYKVGDVVRRVFHETGTEADTWLADSYEDIPLAYNDDYRFVYRGADGNASAVVFTERGKAYLDQPLFVVVSCPYTAPYGKSTLFTTYTSESPCPVRLLVPMMQYLLGMRYPQAFPEEEAKGLKRIGARVVPRKNEGEPMPQRVVVHRVMN